MKSERKLYKLDQAATLPTSDCLRMILGNLPTV